MRYRLPVVLWTVLVVSLMLSMAASPARADDLQGQTKQDFINALTPTTRGLSVGGGSPHKDMRIQFEFGSAQLTDSARTVLDELGAALQSNELSTFEFSLVGHTDTVGSDAVNLELSKARAQAVKEYLISKFNISAERLQADGVGKSDLADPDNPTSGLNRRVVITNIGS